jgi:hypothetical protein
LCSLERPRGIFFGEKLLAIDAQGHLLASVCLLVDGSPLVCIFGWGTPPHIRQKWLIILSHVPKFIVMLQVDVVLFDCITFLGTCIHGRSRNVGA